MSNRDQAGTDSVHPGFALAFVVLIAPYAGCLARSSGRVKRYRSNKVEQVRQQGFFQVLTPAQCLEQANFGTTAFILHLLASVIPVDETWQCLRLFGEQVMPKIR